MKGKIFKSKRFYKKKPSVNFIKSYVSGILKKNIELKHSSASLNTTASTTATLTQITSSIAVGTGDTSARIGDRYLLKNMVIGFNVGLADATNIIRCVLFQWNEASTPDSSVFEDTATGGALGMTMGSFSRDKQQAGVLKIIKDWHFTLNSGNPSIYTGQKKIDLKSCKPVQMYGGSATNGKGTLWLIYVSDSAAVSHPSFQSHWTINYTDA